MVAGYAGLKLCVTGGSGAVGSVLVDALLENEARTVVAFDSRLPVAAVRSTADPRVTFTSGDVTRLEAARDAVSGCAVVFHLAAMTSVRDARERPKDCFEVNTFGTAVVLEACRLAGIPRLVFASTSHVYGVPVCDPIDERHPTDPISVYGASKLAAEQVIRGYASSYHISCRVARIANLYGPRSSMETVVGRAVGLATAGRPIALRSLSPQRDFIYVTDVVDVLLRLGTLDVQGEDVETFNVATGEVVSIGKMAETVSEVAFEEGHGRVPVVEEEIAARDAAPRIALSYRRLADATGWAPTVTLRDGLRATLRALRPDVT